MRRVHARLSLEALEARWVPATIRLVSGILQVSNQTGDLTITQVANGKFSVLDGAKASGTFSGVNSIQVTGTNAANKITVDLASFSLGGSLLINSGNGNDTIELLSAGGRIGSSLTVLTGLGDDTVLLNKAGAGDLTIGGTVTLTDTQSGLDTAYFGGAGGILTIGGSVTLTAFNFIRLDSNQPNVFRANFSASLGVDSQFIDIRQTPVGLATLTVGGSLSVTGGPQNDFAELDGIIISKDLSFNFRETPAGTFNGVNLTDTNITQVLGNFYYTGGSGDDQLDLADTLFDGNVILNMGVSGDDFFALDNVITGTVIGGDLRVTAGGNLDTTPFGTGIQATIGGSVIFNLGNGDINIVFADGGTAARYQIRAGNGNNNVEFLGATTYLTNIIFGSGDNTLTLNNSLAVLSGYIQGGGGANVFNQIDGTLLDITLVNFP